MKPTGRCIVDSGPSSPPDIQKVADRESWRNTSSRRTSKVPIHVLVTTASQEAAELVEELCAASDVYSIYVFRAVANAVPTDLEGCMAPVFLVTSEQEAHSFAERLVSGDFSVLENAVNGDEILYRYLSAFPS